MKTTQMTEVLSVPIVWKVPGFCGTANGVFKINTNFLLNTTTLYESKSKQTNPC